MSGGSKAPKPTPVEVSQGEQIQTRLAKDQYAYYAGTYAPLAKQMADESNADYSGRFAAQNATASMREAGNLYRASAASGGMGDTTSLADAAAQSRLAGTLQGKQSQLSSRLNALEVGLGATADATKSLSQAAHNQTELSIQATRSKMADKQAKADARNAAAGSLVSMGTSIGTAYGLKKMNAQTPVDPKTTTFKDRNQLINGR